MTYILDTISNDLATYTSSLLRVDTPVSIEPASHKFAADLAIPCFVFARKLQKKPQEIATALAEQFSHESVDKAEAVGGFVNLTLKDSVLARGVQQAPAYTPMTYKNKVIVTEYSDPNPFKVLHAGHLYTSVVGFAISNLFESAGGTVHRVNFGGDVGLHVGRTMWSILRELGGEKPENLDRIPSGERSEWMAARYVEGTSAYEDDENAKSEIIALNKKIYQIHSDDDKESLLARIYWTCREWSYRYFDQFYERIGTPFEKYYPESETAVIGLETVKKHIGDVFSESNGAIVFEGEKHGLHTRVFINSEGLPTYEAKDVGLVIRKWEDYHFDESVVITGNEQEQYMTVVLKAVEQFAPDLVRRSRHLTHGLVKLQGGVKMSSRKGNILRAVDVLDLAHQSNISATGRDDEQAVLGAVKYAFLRQRIGGDIIYNPDESVSLEGNSGPYLQYAHARACGILRNLGTTADQLLPDLDENERPLALKITAFPGVINQATNELMPHHICTYLYALAQTFNRFYEKSRIVGDPREKERATLVRAYAEILKRGLAVLGIDAPEKI